MYKKYFCLFVATVVCAGPFDKALDGLADSSYQTPGGFYPTAQSLKDFKRFHRDAAALAYVVYLPIANYKADITEEVLKNLCVQAYTATKENIDTEIRKTDSGAKKDVVYDVNGFDSYMRIVFTSIGELLENIRTSNPRNATLCSMLFACETIKVSAKINSPDKDLDCYIKFLEKAKRKLALTDADFETYKNKASKPWSSIFSCKGCSCKAPTMPKTNLPSLPSVPTYEKIKMTSCKNCKKTVSVKPTTGSSGIHWTN